MNGSQNRVLAALFLAFIGLAAWFQFGLLERDPAESAARAPTAAQPDYYITDFVSTGRDRRGKKYRLSADRLVHYAQTRRARLERPHLIQYALDAAPRHIYADAGWLYDARGSVLLSGNVRVVRARAGQNPATTVSAKTMLIRLKRADG